MVHGKKGERRRRRIIIIIIRNGAKTISLQKFVWVLETGRWCSPGSLVSSTNKTDCRDITEISLKLALNTIK
jgi:hypothetical protein